MFVKRKAIVFYFEQRAGIASWETIAQHPRGSGTKESLCRANESGKLTRRTAEFYVSCRMFRCRGGAGATNEGKQKAFVPPPAGRAGRVPRKSFRGKSCFPLAGFASRGGSFHPAAERVARLWAPPAPSRRAERGTRAGASPVLQTPPRGTAPPGSRNCP